jgi:hypothetical protein
LLERGHWKCGRRSGVPERGGRRERRGSRRGPCRRNRRGSRRGPVPPNAAAGAAGRCRTSP